VKGTINAGGYTPFYVFSWETSAQEKQSQKKQSQEKQSQEKQSQAKQTQAKQTQAKQSQAKQTQAKQSQAKQTQAKQSQDKKDREQKILPQKPVTTVRKSNEGIPARELFNEQTTKSSNPNNPQAQPPLTGDPQNNPSKSRRTLPIEVRRGALARANFKCENCSSTFALQFEHRIPVALGGRGTVENTLLLCRNCNFREGVKVFGVAGMGAR